MEFKYDPVSDALIIRLAAGKSTESEEVRDGFVFDFDEDDRVVGIEVMNASKHVRLELPALPDVGTQDVEQGTEVFTAPEMANLVGLSRRGLEKVVERMREAGQSVGIRPDLYIFTSEDQERISDWRAANPRGRPRSATGG